MNLLNSLYEKNQIKYTDKKYQLPNGTLYEGKGISSYLYEKRLKTDAMKLGINIHKLIEENDDSHIASATILEWYDLHLSEYKSEVFVASEIEHKSLIGYVDTLGLTYKGEYILIDNKITELPFSQQEGRSRWFVQAYSYVQHIYNMTGVLIPEIAILACHPKTGDLNIHIKTTSDYSQLSMVLKSYLTK